jgi:hypothetical protein
MCHLYVLVSSAFSFCWSLLYTQNMVSRLFIPGWGEASDENDTEIQILDVNVDEVGA